MAQSRRTSWQQEHCWPEAPLGPISRKVLVHLNTVQTDQDGKFVYLMASENGKVIARKRPVVVGQLNGDQIEIRKGLVAGDKLISEGFQSLYDGQVITTDVK